MNSLKNFLRNNFYLLALVVIIGFVSVKTYVPETWVSGWDTLHGEFDFKLSLQRAFYGAWQTHQGLGAAASQAHATDIVRLPINLILWLFLPLSAVRYGFFFLTWISGVLGMYFFLQKIVYRKTTLHFFAFLGALFYFFNPITLQQYYVPFEMFAVLFAALPWLIHLSILYVREGEIRHLYLYGVFSLLASPMAHTSTLFYAYVAALIAVLVGSFERKVWWLQRISFVLLTAVAVNIYWLLPNLYYVLNHSAEMSQSFINSTFSDEARLQNQSFGSFDDLIHMRSFLFNWKDFDFEEASYKELLDEWKLHYSTPFADVSLAVVFFLAMAGLCALSFREKRLFLSLFLMMALGAFFLLNSNPPLGFLYDYLVEKIPLFGEGLRFPFTKFSLIFLFPLAVGFSYVFYAVFVNIRWKTIKIVLGMLFSTWLMYVQLPAFSGKMISDSMKVSIPNAYFELFSFLSSQPENSRLLKLPLQTPYGWNYYSWGYQGAGFTWFGIAQPTLDREFDRWNVYNEESYRQFRSRLFSGDSDNFYKMLQKYNVTFVLIDQSIIQPGVEGDVVDYKKLAGMLDSLGAETIFHSDFLTLYKIKSEEKATYTSLYSYGENSNRDVLYEKYGPYIHYKGHWGVPFASYTDSLAYLSSEFSQDVLFKSPLDFTGGLLRTMPDYTHYSWPGSVYIEKQEDSPFYKIDISVSLPGIYDDSGVIFPSQFVRDSILVRSLSGGPDYLFVDDRPLKLLELRTGEKTFLGFLPVRVGSIVDVQLARTESVDQARETFTSHDGAGKLTLVVNQQPPLKLDRTVVGRLSVRLPIEEWNNTLSHYGRQHEHNCTFPPIGKVERIVSQSSILYAANDGGSSCDYYDFTSQVGFDAYILWVHSLNKEGRGFKIYPTTQDAPLATSAFVVKDELEMRTVYPYGESGYTLNLESRSFGKVSSKNELHGIGLLPISTNWMNDIKIYYQESSVDIGDRLMTNNQAYERGWIAFLSGKKVPHIVVNGWENGWVIPEGEEATDATIFFWPQYLQWGGMGVSLAILMLLGLRAHKKQHS